MQKTSKPDSNISGLIYKEDNKYFILVNDNYSLTRQYFTIAHELGHYFLHKNKPDEDTEIVLMIKNNNRFCAALAYLQN